VVKVLEPIVRSDVNKHIDSFITTGRADLVSQLADIVPAEAICRLVGIDDQLVPEVRDSAIAMFAAQGDPDTFAQAMGAFAEIALREVHGRQAAPREDYLTYLTTATVEGEPLDASGYISALTGFLGAGHHTTTSGISSLIYEVFSRPDVRRRLLAEPELTSVAVEEALRLRPPFFGFFRRATTDSAIAGVAIPEGGDVYLGWAAANRDPSVFDCPSEFSLRRGRNRHLSFGAGIHTCPGALLARMELRVCLEQLLLRIPDLVLEIDEPTYVFSGGDYAHITRLPARFTATGRQR
jgi:cytochrome P450